MTLLLLVACQDAAAPASPPPPPTPQVEGDTGLPALAAVETPPITVDFGTPVVCGDSGRDVQFYDRVLLGPDLLNDEEQGFEGAGIAVADFDGDGRHEIFAAGARRSRFWKASLNGWVDRGDQVFAEAVPPHAVGASAADFDGDGDLDLFVTFYGDRNRLYRNDNGSFVEADAGLTTQPWRSVSSSWGDLDGDGFIDLVVGNYGPRPPDAWDPEMAPGDPSKLYLNNGDGTFRDHSGELPQSVHDAYTFMTGWHDVDADGFPELFTVADFGWVRPSQLLWNQQAGALELDDGTANFHPNFAGMGFAVGDINDDQIPDFAQTSYQTISLLQSGQTALSTTGIGWAEFADVLGVNVSEESNQFFGWGAEFGDLDNDADLDLVVGFGHWDEYNNPELQADAAWIQQDSGFVDRAVEPEWKLDDPGSTRGLVLVDIDQDGSLDIVKRVLRRPVVLHQSRCSPVTHALSISVRDDRTPNRFAIGAKIEVTAGPTSQTRWQTAGSSSMFSSGPPEVHIGMSNRLSADRIRITFPGGEVFEMQDVPTDRRLVITRNPL